MLAILPSCAPKPLSLPTGDGVPYDAYAEAYASATADCRDVRTLTAELRLSGRAGRQKLRGRALVGVAAPDRIRLEALAPFGPPVFILAARDNRATLLLPRDDRVVRDEPPAAIVEALAGVEVDPATLRAALAGCALDAGTARSGREVGDRWLVIDMGDERTVFLQRLDDGGWRVRGARTPAFTLTYDELGPRLPTRLTIVARADAGEVAEVRLAVADPELNVALGDEAFEVDVPASALPLSLEELRDAGPLGDTATRGSSGT
jgi:hypothetical protein